ncbi:MAG: DUF1045 domain-containing protein [Pseudomonadota bacterium]
MAPPPLHDAASSWLGWDSRTGQTVRHPQLQGLPDSPTNLTASPRKYGFDATMKAPFRLADDATISDLRAACADRLPELGASFGEAVSARLLVSAFNGFVAAIPSEPSETLNALAAGLVEEFDDFRAPLTDEELNKRRSSRLTSRQEQLLRTWGYPFVMEAFQFHMTLTGQRPHAEALVIADVLKRHFARVMPDPFEVRTIALLGEATNGFFHVIEEYPLASRSN